jgi:hypothetical protein
VVAFASSAKDGMGMEEVGYHGWKKDDYHYRPEGNPNDFPVEALHPRSSFALVLV